jgi:hypothetical protein
MNTTLDQELRDYHRQFGDDHSGLRAKLAARLEGLAPEPAHASRGRRWKWRSLSLAATAAVFLIAIAAWLLSPGDLCARVLDALKAASTVHAEGTGYDADGKKIARIEVWYDRQRGVREEAEVKGRKHYRLDDGTNQWQFDAGADFATRSESSDPLGLVRKLLSPEKAIRRAVRQPDQDLSIDGVPCQCHRSESPERPSRYRIWIDAQFRARRYVEEHRQGDGWFRDEVIDIHWDVPIEAKRFVPDFTKGLKVITADESSDDRYSLKHAVATKEVMGNVLAVHEIQRISDRTVYLVYSIRPADKTLAKFGHHPQGYGIFWAQVLKPPGMMLAADWTIAECSDHRKGAKIKWCVMSLIGRQAEMLKELPICGQVTAQNQLAKELDKAGKPWYEYSSKPLMTVPLPKSRQSLEEVTARTYEEIKRLMPYPREKVQAHLNLRTVPLSERSIQSMIRNGTSEKDARNTARMHSSTPSETSLKEFQAAVKEKIEKLESP